MPETRTRNQLGKFRRKDYMKKLKTKKLPPARKPIPIADKVTQQLQAEPPQPPIVKPPAIRYPVVTLDQILDALESRLGCRPIHRMFHTEVINSVKRLHGAEFKFPSLNRAVVTAAMEGLTEIQAIDKLPSSWKVTYTHAGLWEKEVNPMFKFRIRFHRYRDCSIFFLTTSW